MPAPLVSQVAQRVMDGRRGKRTMMAAFAPSFEEFYLENVLCSAFQRREQALLFSTDLKTARRATHLCDEYADKLERSALLRSTVKDAIPRYRNLAGRRSTDQGRPYEHGRIIGARVPFLDYRVVELAARIPPTLGSCRMAPRRRYYGKHLQIFCRHRLRRGLSTRSMFRIGPWLRQNLRPLVEDWPNIHPFGKAVFSTPHTSRGWHAHTSRDVTTPPNSGPC